MFTIKNHKNSRNCQKMTESTEIFLNRILKKTLSNNFCLTGTKCLSHQLFNIADQVSK